MVARPVTVAAVSTPGSIDTPGTGVKVPELLRLEVDAVAALEVLADVLPPLLSTPLPRV